MTSTKVQGKAWGFTQSCTAAQKVLSWQRVAGAAQPTLCAALSKLTPAGQPHRQNYQM